MAIKSPGINSQLTGPSGVGKSANVWGVPEPIKSPGINSQLTGPSGVGKSANVWGVPEPGCGEICKCVGRPGTRVGGNLQMCGASRNPDRSFICSNSSYRRCRLTDRPVSLSGEDYFGCDEALGEPVH